MVRGHDRAMGEHDPAARLHLAAEFADVDDGDGDGQVPVGKWVMDMQSKWA
jgi:hypothetical protein